jgi:hypothetical protein
MSSTKSQLRLIGAVAVLATLALAGSCRGFFPGEQLQSITIQPSTATVPLGGTTQMRAFGVNTDGNQAGDVTSKVSWTSDSGAVTVNSTNQPGLLTGISLSSTTATITASYQALTPQTATAAVCVEGGSNFQLVPDNSTIVGSQAFPNGGGFTASVDAQVSGTSQTVDVTSGVAWASSNVGVISITNGTDPATVVLTDPTVQTPVTITATYTCNGVAITKTTTITVNP